MSAHVKDQTAVKETAAVAEKKPVEKKTAGPESFNVVITKNSLSMPRVDAKVGDSVTWANSTDQECIIKFTSAPAPKPAKPAKDEPEPAPVAKRAPHDHDKMHGHECGTLTAECDLPATCCIRPNQSFSRAFTAPGCWEYCDETNPMLRGSVVVA